MDKLGVKLTSFLPYYRRNIPTHTPIFLDIHFVDCVIELFTVDY